MPPPKTGTSQKGQPLHYSVGALIENNDSYLLIDRAIPPLGFAGIAGHIDEGETPAEALVREVREESGLRVLQHQLLAEEELDWNLCSRGISTHYWYLFACTVSGSVTQNQRETKSIAWYTHDQIKKLDLEPVWKYWFEKLGLYD